MINHGPLIDKREGENVRCVSVAYISYLYPIAKRITNHAADRDFRAGEVYLCNLLLPTNCILAEKVCR